MRLEPIHLCYKLSRRQQLVAHLGTWLSPWPGVLLMVAVFAIAVALAVLASPWFLALLLLPPMHNNLPRLIAGFVRPLFTGARRMEVVIEADRIGQRLGQQWQWLPLEEIVGIERFGDVWTILSSGMAVDIPLSALDEKCLVHLRAMKDRAERIRR